MIKRKCLHSQRNSPCSTDPLNVQPKSISIPLLATCNADAQVKTLEQYTE